MKQPNGKLVDHEENPIPHGAQPGLCETPDGRLLRYALWDPPAGSRKGTVCIFEGRGEFIEKYFETVRDLQARGYGVAVLDWRGQGGSGFAKRRFFGSYVASFDEYEDDLITFMQTVVLPDCAPPFHVIAHSTGALVVAENLLRRTWFEKAIFTGPLFGFSRGVMPWRLVHISSGILTAFGLGGLSLPGRSARSFAGMGFFGNPFTSDEDRFDRIKGVLKTAPQLSSKRPKIGWLFAAFRAMSELNAIPNKVHLCAPVMILSSRRDQIVAREAADEFSEKVQNATNIVIDGAKHEILLERDDLREQFWSVFDTFFDGAEPLVSAGQNRPSAQNEAKKNEAA
ncbi:MAG: alpha/beta fold hydrolase [Hyphomicrobiales bacterium]